MSNLDIAAVQKQLANAEELLEIAKKTREDAIMAKTESETKLNICIEELAKLGITPENAQTELDRLESEIMSELAEIDASIPKDLLVALKRI